MTLGTFQAVKFGGSKGGPGAVAGATGRAWRAGAEAGCRALEDGSGKEGEPKAERAGNIDHTAVTVNHSKARRTRQARSDKLCEYPLLDGLEKVSLTAANTCVTAENEVSRREREQQRKYIENLNDSLKHYTVQNEELSRRLAQSSVGMAEGEKEDVEVE